MVFGSFGPIRQHNVAVGMEITRVEEEGGNEPIQASFAGMCSLLRTFPTSLKRILLV